MKNTSGCKMLFIETFQCSFLSVFLHQNTAENTVMQSQKIRMEPTPIIDIALRASVETRMKSERISSVIL